MRHSSAIRLGLAGLFFGLVVLALSLPGQTGPQPTGEQTAHKIKKGIKYTTRKQFERAQDLFKEVLSKF